MKNTLLSSRVINHCELKNPLSLDYVEKTAMKIMTEFMSYRRIPKATKTCSNAGCAKCLEVYLPKIISAIQNKAPVSFVLPAFPGKSPNPEKVLGVLPDHAERLSLIFFKALCQRIKEYYPPGIKIILCSDGRVFSDVVGMNEDNVTAYQIKLTEFIDELSIPDIETFNLDDFYKNLNFFQMRDELMKSYGDSLSFLKNKIRNGAKDCAQPEEQEANQMYLGITRFLFEDSIHSEQKKSRSIIQKESRLKAYEVIQRSNAWTKLIAERFPNAIRLSIHPQTCGSQKLGIRLIGNECWMTPWHGVAVEMKGGYSLFKRSEAEAMGAQLIYSDDGLPSHYRATDRNFTSLKSEYAL